MAYSSLTTSAIISFAERLEENSSAFYQALAERFDQGEDAFLRFARESQKNKVHLVRTYQETISDALEASFSFGGLALPEYDFGAALEECRSFELALEKALQLEDQASETYARIAEQARPLLATIPLAFSRVAKKRKARKEDLQSMLDEA